MKNRRKYYLGKSHIAGIALSFISTGILLFVTMDHRFIGAGLGVTAFLFLISLRRHTHFSPQSAGAETHQKTTAHLRALGQHPEKTTDINLSVIGTEYRRREQREFEHTVNTILDTCITLIENHIDAYTIGVFFPTENGGLELRRFRSKTDAINADTIIRPGIGIIGSFLKDGLTQLKLNDIVTDSMTLFYYTRNVGIHSLIASPIMVGSTKRGTILVDSTNKDHFTDEMHAFLNTIAELCGQSVYHAYMSNQRRLDYERLMAMSNTENYFFKEHSIDAVLDKLIEIIPFSFPCDRLSISLLGHKPDEAIINRVWGKQSESLLNLTFSIKEKSLANILYTRNICFFRNFSQDHYELRYSPVEQHFSEFKSFLAFPLGVNECKGMILLESLHEEAYTESTKELLSRLAHSAGIAIEKIQILKHTENLAIRDGLTGLYNRRQFQHMMKESITRSIRYKKPVALVMCDIDHFKNLNDSYGHRFGDLALKEISIKLQSSIREGIDTAARYGGEEFALILNETAAVSAKETVERIRQQIADMLFTTPQGTTLHCTMSFGIAIYPIHAKSQESLIRRADKALYRAKETGRNKVEVIMEEQENG